MSLSMHTSDGYCTYQAHAGGDHQENLHFTLTLQNNHHYMLTGLEDGTGLPGERDMVDLRDSARVCIARSCLKRAIFCAR